MPTSPTATPTAHCARCGRTLRAAESVARGYGPACARKVRTAARVVDLTAYKAAQVEKAAELLEQCGIVRVGELFLSVSSDGSVRYETDPLRQACTCKAGQHGRRCYHLAAAAILSAA